MMVRFSFAMAAMALAFAQRSEAATVMCLHTPAEFYSAMTLAADGTAGDLDLRLVTGTWHVIDAETLRSRVNLRIAGGYDATCDQRSADASATVFDGGLASGFYLLANRGLVVEGLTLMRYGRVSAPAYTGVRLAVFDSHSDHDFIIRDVTFSWCGPVVLDVSDIAEATIQNSLFLRNTADATGCSASVLAQRHAVPDAVLVTFAQNTLRSDGAACLGGASNATVSYRLLGNLFAPLTSSPGFIVGAGAALRQLDGNLYPGYTGPAPVLPIAKPNLAGIDPMFVGESDGHLADGSPAIDAAPTLPANLLQATDLDGKPRRVGRTSDIGAFENQTDTTAVQTVIYTSDDTTPGTLRAAIAAANANPGTTTIRFAIGCPNTIALSSPLPDIVKPMVIDGYSQAGSSPNTSVDGFNATNCVTLAGNAEPAATHALRVPSSASNDVALTVKGLRLIGFTGAALRLIGGSGHLVQGNQFGAGDVPLLANVTNIQVSGTTQAQIGGPAPADRNAIGWAYGTSGMDGTGVLVTASGQPTIQNNLIGLKPDGTTPAPNRVGIWLANFDGAFVFDNIIAANRSHGITLKGALGIPVSHSVIARNWIGRTPSASRAALGNGGTGIYLAAGDDNAIGDSGFGINVGNAIENNNYGGVWINGGVGNSVRNNRIAFNDAEGNPAALATGSLVARPDSMYVLNLDLGNNGADPNDPGDTDDGANHLQNSPVILAASPAQTRPGTLSGQLWTQPGTYAIDVYQAAGLSCLSDGRGPDLGQRIGTGVVSVASAAAPTTFTLSLPDGYDTNHAWLTATATNLGTNDTSEAASCFDASDADLIFANGFE
jgi:hypothetical protein